MSLWTFGRELGSRSPLKGAGTLKSHSWRAGPTWWGDSFGLSWIISVDPGKDLGVLESRLGSPMTLVFKTRSNLELSSGSGKVIPFLSSSLPIARTELK